MITHVHSVPIVVSDPERALGFYRDGLGFEVTADITDPRSPDNRWLTLKPRSGQTNLMLLKASAIAPEMSARLGKPTFMVVNTDYLRGDCELIKLRGGRILTEPKRAGWGNAMEAQVADPDGNVFLLIQPEEP